MATYYWVGGAGTWNNSSSTNWSATSGGSGGAGVPIFTDIVIFDSLSGTGTCSVASTAQGGTTTQNSAGITIQLTASSIGWAQASLTLTQGTIDLNEFGTSTPVFSSSNTNVRTLDFGTNGLLEISGNNGTVFNATDHTNLTLAGSKNIVFNYAGGVGTRTILSGNYATTTAANAFFLQFLPATDTVNISAQAFDTLNFALGGGFTGTLASSGLRSFGGGITFTSGMTISGITGSISFRNTGSATFTTNGKTVPVPLFMDGAGGTTTFVGSYTSSSYISLDQGTLGILIGTINATYITSGSAGARTLDITSDTVNLSNASAFATVFSLGTGTVTLNSSSSTINVSSATATTFDGGGRTFATVNQAGAGALTIAGSNTFTTLSNSVQPTTFRFTSGTTQTVTNFTVSGTAGNLVTINATTPGTRATLSKASGTVSVSNCSITDSSATGGAVWRAFTTNGNVDGGNNLGWVFSPPGGGNFLAFFM
jgi:hypothetical protein